MNKNKEHQDQPSAQTVSPNTNPEAGTDTTLSAKVANLEVVHPAVGAPRLKAGDDELTAKELVGRFGDAQNGMRRIMALGLFAWEIKEQHLNRGEFGPWLAAYAPALARTDAKTGKTKASSALSSYMGMAKDVLESHKFTIKKYLGLISNSHARGNCRGGNFLLLPDAEVPKEIRPLHNKICSSVDGKTKRQIMLGFKQVEDDGDGNLKVKRGRRKGEGGASKEQREQAAGRDEKDRLEAIKLEATNFVGWINQNADNDHLGKVEDQAFNDLLSAALHLVIYMRPVAAARQGLKDCSKQAAADWLAGLLADGDPS
jgi:hypothetical protein